jgi:hypothetical protein
MRRGCSRRQCALPLEVTDVPERLLRAAYERVAHRLKLSYEQAMEDRMWSMCIRNIAITSAMKGRTV